MVLSLIWGCAQKTDVDGLQGAQLVEKDVAQPGTQSQNAALSGIINGTSHTGTKAFLQAMSATFSNDPSLRAASIRAAGFSKQADDLSSPLRPEVLADASTFQDGITVTANQPLYDFGKRKARVAQVRADRLSEINSLADQKETLLRAGLDAVLDVQFASESIAVRNRQISGLRAALRAADSLERLGLITAADKRFAEVELQRAQVELTETQNASDQAKRVWVNVAGTASLPGAVDLSSLRHAAGIGGADKAMAVSALRNLEVRALDVAGTRLTQKHWFSNASVCPPSMQRLRVFRMGRTKVCTGASRWRSRSTGVMQRAIWPRYDHAFRQAMPHGLRSSESCVLSFSRTLPKYLR
jgi:hypothetical protein